MQGNFIGVTKNYGKLQKAFTIMQRISYSEMVIDIDSEDDWISRVDVQYSR